MVTLHIKNMVCDRCITTVEQTLTKLEVPFEKVVLGNAFLTTAIDDIDIDLLDAELQAAGFELIRDKKQKFVEDIKNIIVDFIHYSDDKDMKINFSDYLSEKLNKDYSYISGVFSELEKITIEKYIILHKVERVKELISYDNLNFSEIAYRLNYSSIAHLSGQFKRVTDLTLSQYKDSAYELRKSLDKI